MSDQPFSGQYKLPKQLRSDIQDVLSKYKVAGLSISVVRKEGDEWQKGVTTFGIRDGTRAPWEVNSKQGIASASKVYTAASIGLLIDRKTPLPGGGVLTWSTRVKEVLPDWTLVDKNAEEHADVEDLLSMRLGIPGNNAAWGMDGETVETMIHRMRYHQPAAPLRKVGIYSNDNFTVAGKIVSILSGMPYHEFVKRNILDPLGMSDSQYDRNGAKASGRRVEGFQHYGIDKLAAADLIAKGEWGEACSGKLAQTEFWTDDGMHFAAAGGLWSTADDICLWLRETLDPRILPLDLLAELNRPRIQLTDEGPHPTISRNYYGIGQYTWYYRGHRIVGHHGGLPGHYSAVLRLPDSNIGLAVFANDEVYGNPMIFAATQMVLDELLGVQEKVDWAEVYLLKELKVPAKKEDSLSTESVRPSDGISGEYHSEQYGPLKVTLVDEHPQGAIFRSLLEKSPGNTLPIRPGAPVYIGDLRHDLAGKIFLTPHDGPIFTRAYFKAEGIDPLDPADKGKEQFVGHVYMQGRCVVTDEGIGMFEDFWGQGGTGGGLRIKQCVEKDVGQESEVWFGKVA